MERVPSAAGLQGANVFASAYAAANSVSWSDARALYALVPGALKAKCLARARVPEPKKQEPEGGASSKKRKLV